MDKDKIKDLMFKAIEFATAAHRGQYRKGTELPYLIHPLGVMKILIVNQCPGEVIIAGVLHDTVEDTPVTIEQIEENFGKTIAAYVSAATGPEKSKPWEYRKNYMIELVKSAPPPVLLLEIADKLDNIQAIQDDYDRLGEDFWSRFNRPKQKQAWYYRSLMQAFLERDEGEPCQSLIKNYCEIVEQVFGDVDI